MSELPAFPAREAFDMYDPIDADEFLMRERNAYKARMEALVEVVLGLLDQQAHPDETLNAYIDELLAACERSKT